MAERQPEVSIVIVVGERRKRSAAALASVLSQDGLDKSEILLVDYAAKGVEALAGADNDRVKVIRLFPPTHFGALKAAGARQAQGRVVAFLEDHIEARPGWLRGVLDAIQGPWAAVGAEVHNANPGVGMSDTLAFINYGLWEPPVESGEREMLAGNNTTYLREALLSQGDALDELLISDTVLQWVIQRQGYRLYLDSSISLLHRNPTTLPNGVLAEFFYHWCFGAVRAKIFQWPWWKRLAYIGLAPVMPWLRLRRLLRLAREKGSERANHIWRAIVPTTIILHAAILGQSLGLLFGLEGGKQRFTEFELNSARPKAEELAQ